MLLCPLCSGCFVRCLAVLHAATPWHMWANRRLQHIMSLQHMLPLYQLLQNQMPNCCKFILPAADWCNSFLWFCTHSRRVDWAYPAQSAWNLSVQNEDPSVKSGPHISAWTDGSLEKWTRDVTTFGIFKWFSKAIIFGKLIQIDPDSPRVPVHSMNDGLLGAYTTKNITKKLQFSYPVVWAENINEIIWCCAGPAEQKSWNMSGP